MKRTIAAAIIGMMATSSVWAETAAKADPAKAEQYVTTVCAGCHGMDGNSPIPANPNLAGQHPDYIAKQLADFKSGERKNPIMTGMAAMLATPEDIKNVSAYFGLKTAKPGTVNDKDLAALGRKLYKGGNMANGLPACASCHGANGAGVPAQFPRLAGQYQDYTIAQLTNFRTGERANDSAKMMRTIAAKMTDQEIKAVAEYIAGLQ
ncbi:MAG: c-type cytochrome [Pseudomonadota bacterium]|jgi:cytochrome c553